MPKTYNITSIDHAYRIIYSEQEHCTNIIKQGAYTPDQWNNMIKRINGLMKKIKFCNKFIQENQ